MQEFAKFVSLTRIPGSSSIVQGIKGGKAPKNAIRGDNGSYRTYDRAKVFLTVKYKGKRYTKDIYIDIKKAADDKRITDKFCCKLQNAFKDFKFTIKYGEFTNIDKAIEYAIGQ